MADSSINLISKNDSIEIECEEFLGKMYSVIQNNKLYVVYYKNKLVKREYYKFIKMVIDTIKETNTKFLKEIILLCFAKFFDSDGFIFYSNLDREIIKSLHI